MSSKKHIPTCCIFYTFSENQAQSSSLVLSPTVSPSALSLIEYVSSISSANSVISWLIGCTLFIKSSLLLSLFVLLSVFYYSNFNRSSEISTIVISSFDTLRCFFKVSGRRFLSFCGSSYQNLRDFIVIGSLELLIESLLFALEPLISF